MADRERRIQEIAYLLWEGEGRPDGQAERFWHMAEAAYEAEAEMTGGGGGETPATALADVAEVEATARAPRFAPEFDTPKTRAPAAKAKAAKAEPDKPAAAKAKPADAKANGGGTIAAAPKAEPAPAKAAAKPAANAARFKPR